MNTRSAKVSEKNVAQALINVRAMDLARKVRVASEIVKQQPLSMAMVLAQRQFGASLEQIEMLLELLLTCWEAMRESGHTWPHIDGNRQERCLARLTGHLKFADDLPLALKNQALDDWTNSHVEKPLLAHALLQL